MYYTVVISHNQTDYISQFVSRLKSHKIVFVFDNPTQADLNVVHKSGIDYVIMHSMGNRSANRNAGLALIEANYSLSDDDIIEFYDGDRIPLKYSEKDFSDIDVLLYTCEKDKRLLKIKPGKVVTNTLCNPFYSCGFGIKYSAVKKIEDFNDGFLFNSEFKGWGCEDQYLGLQCDKLGLSVYLTDDICLAGQVGGDELSHENYMAVLQQYIDITRSNGLFPNYK